MPAHAHQPSTAARVPKDWRIEQKALMGHPTYPIHDVVLISNTSNILADQLFLHPEHPTRVLRKQFCQTTEAYATTLGGYQKQL
jgi:hypothetical protein